MEYVRHPIISCKITPTEYGLDGSSYSTNNVIKMDIYFLNSSYFLILIYTDLTYKFERNYLVLGIVDDGWISPWRLRINFQTEK